MVRPHNPSDREDLARHLDHLAGLRDYPVAEDVLAMIKLTGCTLMVTGNLGQLKYGRAVIMVPLRGRTYEQWVMTVQHVMGIAQPPDGSFIQIYEAPM